MSAALNGAATERPATPAVLEWRDFSVDFAGQTGITAAVREVTLQVSQGEILAVVGESGSGKSVTALAAMQLLPDTARCSGSIRVQGKEMIGAAPGELAEVRGRGIGMIFQ